MRQHPGKVADAAFVMRVEPDRPGSGAFPRLHLVEPIVETSLPAPSATGHRARLRQRLIEGGPDALLDHELIELVVAMPPEMKIKGGETKYILKKAMVGIVPKEILYREKQGFGVPIREWINQQLRSRINDDLNDRKTLERGYFDASYIKRLLDEHSKGRRDHSHALWTLWMLELWHREFLDA